MPKPTVRIPDASPEELARAVTRQVNVEKIEEDGKRVAYPPLRGVGPKPQSPVMFRRSMVSTIG